MKSTGLTALLLAATSACAGMETVTIQNAELSVTIARKGAELQSIRHRPTDTEYLWQGDPAFWANRAPNMFPVNVRFKDDRFTYQGRPYAMPRMGLAVTAEFAGEEIGDSPSSVVLLLESSEKTLRYYPFPFRLEITSELTGLRLTQRYRIMNTGRAMLYFALGGHPGIRTPLIHGRTRADYEIRFTQPLRVDRPEISDGLVTTKRIPFLADEDRLRLDDPRVPSGGMFLENSASRQIGVALKGREPYVTVDLGDFPNTNLWSPPGMPYVCVEPMVAHHDFAVTPEAIEEKSHLVSLPAGAARTYQFSLLVHPEEGRRALK